MAFLIIGRERYALQIGDTRLGGSAENELPLPSAAPHATLSLMPDGTATLRREGDSTVSVNGTVLSDEPIVLRHGDRIRLAEIPILFGDIAAAGSTSLIQGVPESALAALAGIAGNTPTSDTGGVLVRVAEGVSFDIPDAGLVIGRDPGCDVVLRDKGTSRRHATVRPSLQGYVISDHSVNGLMVNGRRVDGTQVLGMGDIVRIGDEEFRFDADAASFEPDAALRASALPAVTASELAAATAGAPIGEVVAAQPPASSASGAMPSTVEKPRPEDVRLLATLEVINKGVHEGVRFRLERAVSQVGRSRQSDVRLDDDSVSGSHATLMRRSVGWVVVDLDSTNGTYVDGTRIRGEHALPGVCEVRFGGIKMVFRPIAGSAADDSSTRAIVGVPS